MHMSSSYIPGVGHGPMIDPPDYDYYCHTCHDDPCTCNQPPHDAAYMAAWRDGAFDDDLCGWTEELAVVGFEKVVAG